MSFLQSLFGGQGQQQQQQQPNGQQQQQNQPQGQTNGQPPANGQAPANNPAQGGNVNGTNTPVDPVEFYNKMWQNNPNQQSEAPPKLAIDSDTLSKVSSQIDFTQGIDPQLVQKATSGDINSLMQLMNAVSQNTYRTAMQHQSAVTDAFVGQREEFFGKKIPSVIRDELTMNSISSSAQKAPAFVKQQLSEIAKKMQAANPDASPEEIATAARQYVADLSKAVNGDSNQGQAQSQQRQEAVDWDAYFESNS